MWAVVRRACSSAGVGYAQFASALPCLPRILTTFCKPGAADRSSRAEEQGVCQLWPPLHTSTQQSANPFDNMSTVHRVVTKDKHEISENKNHRFDIKTLEVLELHWCLLPPSKHSTNVR